MVVVVVIVVVVAAISVVVTVINCSCISRVVAVYFSFLYPNQSLG